MSDILKLPVGWLNIPMQEAVFNVNGARKPVSLKLRAEIQGYYPYYGATGQIDSLNDFTHEGEHVLIGEDGANLLSKTKDLAFIVEGQFWVNNHAHAVKCLADMPSKFLAGYVNSLDLTPYITGSAQPKLTKGNLEKIPFPLPPLAEQKVIAEKLDKLLAKVDSIKARLDAVPDTLKRFRQSVLAAATSGDLTTSWRDKNSLRGWDMEALKADIYEKWLTEKEREFQRKGKKPATKGWMKKFPEIQSKKLVGGMWLELSLENVANVVDPNPSHRMPKYVSDGVPFISSENVVSLHKIDFKKGKQISEVELNKQKERYEIEEGAFAFTRIGTIGKSVILPSPHNYGISHAMAVVTPYKGVVNSNYLILAMNCESIINQAFEGVQSVGVPDLGLGKMKAFRIPIPPIHEQTEIVRRVEKLFAYADKVEAEVNAAQDRVNKLTQSILAKAFRGELTAKWRGQNPELISGDNSAEALLASIQKERKAEREKLKSEKNTRTKKNSKEG